MRKLARVGRPARWAPSSARTSGSRSSVVAAGAGLAEHAGQLAAGAAPTCHWSARSDVGQRRRCRCVSASTHSPSGRVPVSRSVTAPSRSTSSASRPARSTRLLPTSSSGSVAAEPGAGVLAHRDAGQHPVEAELPGVVDERREAERLPVLLVEAPPDAGLPHPVGDRVEVVVAEAEPAAYRRGAWARSSTCARGDPAAGEVEQLGGDAEQRVGRLSARSASRTRSRWAGWPPGDDLAEPERRPRSAARRSRCRGTSRGCRAARASGRPGAARGAPRAARRPGGPDRGRRAPAPSGRRRRARGPVRGDGVGARGRPGASPAACRGPLGAGGAPRRRRRPGQAALQLADVAAQRGQQRVADPRWPGSSSRGHGPGGVGQRLPQRVAGVRQPQVDVVVVGERGEQLDLGDRQPGVAEQREPAGQVEPAAGAQPREHASACRSSGGGAPTSSTSARQSGGLPAPGRRRAAARRRRCRGPREPVDQHLRPLRGVRREQARQPAGHRVATAASQLGLRHPYAVAEVGGERGGPRLVEAGRRAPSAAATPARRGSHGSSRVVPVSSSDTSDRGERNSTPAQTPSSPAGPPRAGGRAAARASARSPGPAPRPARWRTGPSSGSESRSARPSASRSVRSARWRNSVTRAHLALPETVRRRAPR